MRVAQVVPDLTAGKLEDTYTYLVPADMQVARGDAVLAPFGNRTIVGFIESLGKLEAEPEYELRAVQEKIEGVRLPQNLLDLVDFVADEFACTTGAAISAAVPPGIRTRLVTYYEGVGDGETPTQEVIMRALSRRGRLSEKALSATKGFTASALKSLIASGKVCKTVGLAAERRKAGGGYVLADAVIARE